MSLRARLLVGMGVVAVVLVGTAAVIARTTESDLVDRVDAQLVAALPTVQRRPGLGRLGADRPPPIESESSLTSLYVGYLGRNSSLVVLAAPNLSGDDVPLPQVPVGRVQTLLAGEQGPAFLTVTAEDDSARFRLLAAPRPAGGALLLGLSLQDVDASIDHLTVVEVIGAGSVVAILALVTLWVIRLGVRPIKQMTATATAIADGDLSRRALAVRAGTEAGELGAALNTMLARIEDAFGQRAASEERLRRFVADASHELRTPVTTIRGYAELHRRGGLSDPGELAQAMRRTEEEAVRMASLVDDLLLLARLDQEPVRGREHVDVGSVVADVVADARVRAPDRAIASHGTGFADVIADEGQLRQVLANLVDNAIRHTPAGTPVEVLVQGGEDTVVVEVRDEGPGVPDDVAARTFERFFRADPSRSRRSGGSGLGLAIVRAIVEAHGGTVSLTSQPGRGTTARVELPRAPGARFSGTSEVVHGDP